MPDNSFSRRDFIATGATIAGAAGLGACAKPQTGPDQRPTTKLDVSFGLNMLVYTPSFSKDKTDLIKKVADFGYDGVEIPFNDLSILDAKATRQAREKADVGLTACCVMMPGTNLCSTEPDERKAGVERVKKMLDITAEMGGDAIAGPIYSPVSYLSGTGRTDDEWKWCIEGLKAAGEHAEEVEVDIAIEPLNRFETYVINTNADCVDLCKEVGSPNVKVQLDTFHANIEEKNTPDAIREAGSLLGHFHASESDRGTPGTGQVSWEECFAALDDIGYDRWVTIESFAIGIRELCKAACIWRPIYESADTLAKDGLAFLKKTAGVA